MNKYSKQLLFWFITLCVPFLVLLLIEGGLRLGGYNQEAQDLFIEAPNSSKFLVSNPKFIGRYFLNFTPQIAPNAFRKQKKPNTFRIFVFGGSSTQGFPYNFYYSFSDQLEQRLLLNTEGVNVEVVNLGMTAVNSYVIRDLSKRVMDYKPDAIIIYAGHNEYYGSFGAGSTQFGFVNNIGIKRLILWLKNWRFYQWMESIASSNSEETSERRTMMAKVIRNSNIQLNGKIYHHGIQQFKSNIEDVVNQFTSNNIPVFIGTVASNLKDQEPLTDDQTALKVFQDAEKLFVSGDTVSAFQKYQEAKELDGIRFRAPKAMNEVIRKLSVSDLVTIVETEKLLRASSESSIEDESLFIDHLHPNHVGHQLMSDLFLEQVISLPRLRTKKITNEFESPKAITQFEDVYARLGIDRLLVGYPFKKGITVEEELEVFQRIYDEYLTSTFIDSIAAVSSRESRFVPPILTEVINTLQARNDTVNAFAHYYELMKWQLNSINLIEKGIEYAINNRATDHYLANMILQILNDGNYDSRYMDVLSSLYLLRGNTDNAQFWLKESERINPNSARMLYNYTRFYLIKGDTVKAQEYYRRYLNIQKGN